jgi:hypothetical protein
MRPESREWVPPSRQSGVGFKPLQAGVVKSDGGERCKDVGTHRPSLMRWTAPITGF